MISEDIHVNKCPTSCNHTQFILSVNCVWFYLVGQLFEQFTDKINCVWLQLVGHLLKEQFTDKINCVWLHNIRMDLQKVGIWTGLGWPTIETGDGRL